MRSKKKESFRKGKEFSGDEKRIDPEQQSEIDYHVARYGITDYQAQQLIAIRENDPQAYRREIYYGFL